MPGTHGVPVPFAREGEGPRKIWSTSCGQQRYPAPEKPRLKWFQISTKECGKPKNTYLSKFMLNYKTPIYSHLWWSVDHTTAIHGFPCNLLLSASKLEPLTCVPKWVGGFHKPLGAVKPVFPRFSSAVRRTPTSRLIWRCFPSKVGCSRTWIRFPPLQISKTMNHNDSTIHSWIYISLFWRLLW